MPWLYMTLWSHITRRGRIIRREKLRHFRQVAWVELSVLGENAPQRLLGFLAAACWYAIPVLAHLTHVAPETISDGVEAWIVIGARRIFERQAGLRVQLLQRHQLHHIVGGVAKFWRAPAGAFYLARFKRIAATMSSNPTRRAERLPLPLVTPLAQCASSVTRSRLPVAWA